MYPKYEVIVVDNNSSDGSTAMVEREFPQAQLLRLHVNKGVAGWNAGFDAASGAFVLVLDDDSYPEPTSLDQAILKMQQNPMAGVFAFRIRTISGDFVDSPGLCQVEPCTFIGCGALIRSEVFRMIGMYSDLLFLYQHELDFSIRLYNAGYSTMYDPALVVVHAENPSHRLLGKSGISRRKLFYDTRNVVLILLLYFPLHNIIGRIFRLVIGRTLYAFVSGSLGTILLAWFSVVTHLPNVIRLRSIVNRETQRRYINGAFAGGFFSDHPYAFRRPSFLTSSSFERE